jgi:hypothetical protein
VEDTLRWLDGGMSSSKAARDPDTPVDATVVPLRTFFGTVPRKSEASHFSGVSKADGDIWKFAERLLC